MNIYEQWTYEALDRQGFAVFTPVKDRGVDCIVTGMGFHGRPQRVQVKGSKGHGEDQGWYQFTAKKLAESVLITDFWIFVRIKTLPRGQLGPEFLVVPTGDLEKRLTSYGKPSKGKYNIELYPVKTAAGPRRVDGRNWPNKLGWPPPDPQRDYTHYLDNWSLIRVRL